MAIGNGITFGVRNNSNETAKTDDRPKAKYWANIGQLNEAVDEASGEIVTTFVGVIGGIALDTAQMLDITKGTKMFVAKQTARNQLHGDVLEACKRMAPGEDIYIGDGADGGLVIQLHCVKAEAEVVAPSENPFRRKFTLV